MYVNGILNCDAVTSDPQSIGRVFRPYFDRGVIPTNQRDFRYFFVSQFFNYSTAIPLAFSVQFFVRVDNNCTSSSLLPLPSDSLPRSRTPSL